MLITDERFLAARYYICVFVMTWLFVLAARYYMCVFVMIWLFVLSARYYICVFVMTWLSVILTAIVATIRDNSISRPLPNIFRKVNFLLPFAITVANRVFYRSTGTGISQNTSGR